MINIIHIKKKGGRRIEKKMCITALRKKKNTKGKWLTSRDGRETVGRMSSTKVDWYLVMPNQPCSNYTTIGEKPKFYL